MLMSCQTKLRGIQISVYTLNFLSARIICALSILFSVNVLVNSLLGNSVSRKKK